MATWLHTNRQSVGVTLLVVAAVLFIGTAYFGYRGLRPFGTPSTADKSADTDKKGDTAAPRPEEPADLTRGNYAIAALVTFAAFLLVLTSAGYLLLRFSDPITDEQAKQILVWLLTSGGLLGLLLIVSGLIFMFVWSESLTNWLDKRNFREARWVLLPLLMILLGGVTILLSIWPARSQERHDSRIRHLVYGANFGLTVLLLVVVLIVANVVIAREVPNILDTTATGFYTLSEPTRRLLEQLEQPVRAYVVIMSDPTERSTNDIRQLLLAMQDASNGRFVVRFLSTAADRTELASLRDKYPQFQLVMDQRTTNVAILLTTGQDEKRHAVVSDNDMFDFSRRNFEGEKKLFQEIAFLADSQNKPVVYFTQGHGELDASNNPEIPAERSVNRLRQYLEKNYLEVRTLFLNQPNPKVPDDARIVIIAEPQSPFAPEAIKALREFMNRKENKGKLIYFSGAVPGPDGRVLRTGIEDLLAEFNVRIGNEFLFTLPITGVDYRAPLVGFSVAAEKNPILQSIIRVASRLQFVFPREVAPQNTRSEYQATDLLLTTGITWLEENRPADIGTRIEEILNNERIQEQVRLSRSPRPVAVTVTEGTTPRLVAYGSSRIFSDWWGQQARSSSNPITYDLMGVTVDWLRERQASLAAVNIEAKKYAEYKVPPISSININRLLYMPLGLGLLAVLGLGAGVWVVRSR
ncbi:MAG: GldG family protein [Gemmataceae bacterium]|nr:GldG family protein [Gemmataceae bacterium]MDW8243186.1 Gldg family protein [Thermogemmata sp.]